MVYKKLAIIGTAGRREDQGMLTAEHYQRMVQASIKLIDHLNLNPRELHLVSGGAAWADHLAVTLTLMGVIPPTHLKLYLPAKLEYYGYEGEEGQPWQQRTADTANYYHKLFEQKTGHKSIEQLREVEKKGASLEVITSGFKSRNSRVAREVSLDGTLVAFTFGDPTSSQQHWTIKSFGPDVKADEAGLKDGGTADTFNKAKCVKHHARLGPIRSDQLDI